MVTYDNNHANIYNNPVFLIAPSRGFAPKVQKSGDFKSSRNSLGAKPVQVSNIMILQ